MPDIQLGNVELGLVLVPVAWFIFFFTLGGGRVRDTDHPGSVRIALMVQSFGFALFFVGLVMANVISEIENTLYTNFEVKLMLAICFLGGFIYFIGISRIGARVPLVGRHFLAYRLMTLRKSAKETSREIEELEKIEREYFE